MSVRKPEALSRPTGGTLSISTLAMHTAAMAVVAGALAFTRLDGFGALLIAPFAASAMLAIVASDLPFSQPRAIVGGNVFAATAGQLAFFVMGEGPVTLAAAAALAIGVMLLTRTTHAPAAATAIVAASSDLPWWFALYPVLTGVLAIVALAIVYHRFVRRGVYPRAARID